MKKRTLYPFTHTTANIGVVGGLTPTLIQEVAPGDTWSGKVGQLIRMSPLKRPLTHDLLIDQVYFYVPHRLVWDGWEEFLAAGPNDDTAVSTPPTNNTPNRSIWQCDDNEYKNPASKARQSWNALRNRAVNLVYNEFFRDENVTPVSTDGVPTVPYDLTAWPASGEDAGAVNTHLVSPKRQYWNEMLTEVEVGFEAWAPHRTDLGVAGTDVGVSARDILKAIAQQKLQMKRATYGTRYVDILKSFGVNVNYQMLQRPEIVAVHRDVINVTDVVATDTTSLGKTSGYGVSGTSIKLRRKSFPEHGTLLGFCIVRPPFMDKWINDALDKYRPYQWYYDPALEVMPAQTINQTHVIGPTTLNTSNPIGYIPWGDWYRKPVNRVHHGLEDWSFQQLNHSTDASAQDITWEDLCVYGTGWSLLTQASSFFSDVTYGHYQVSSVNALRALRMINPGNPAAGKGNT